MAIRKHTHNRKNTNKRNNKKNNKRTNKATKRFLKYSKKMRNHRKTKSHNSKSHNNKKHMKGGFSGCGLATVTERGFNIPDLGSIKGMSIPETRAAIYRPNCKTDINQAMLP